MISAGARHLGACLLQSTLNTTPNGGGGLGPGVLTGCSARPGLPAWLQRGLPAACPGLMVFFFWSLKRTTWDRRRQTGLISPGMPALSGSGPPGAMPPPPPRSEARPGTATTTLISSLRRACGCLMRVQAATPQPRVTRSTATTGGTLAGTRVRSWAGALPGHMLGTWGATLSPVRPRGCRRRVSPGTPAQQSAHSHPVCRRRSITAPTARRAPGRPPRGPLLRRRSQNPRSPCRRAGRQPQDLRSHSRRRPDRHPPPQCRASRSRTASGCRPPSSPRHRSGYSSRAS